MGYVLEIYILHVLDVTFMYDHTLYENFVCVFHV